MQQLPGPDPLGRNPAGSFDPDYSVVMACCTTTVRMRIDDAHDLTLVRPGEVAYHDG